MKKDIDELRKKHFGSLTWKGWVALILALEGLIVLLFYTLVIWNNIIEVPERWHFVVFWIVLALFAYPYIHFSIWNRKFSDDYEKHGIDIAPKGHLWRVPTPSGKEIPSWDYLLNYFLFGSFVVLILIITTVFGYESHLISYLRENDVGSNKQFLNILIGLVLGVAASVIFQGINPNYHAKAQAGVFLLYLSYYTFFLFILDASFLFLKDVFIPFLSP